MFVYWKWRNSYDKTYKRYFNIKIYLQNSKKKKKQKLWNLYNQYNNKKKKKFSIHLFFSQENTKILSFIFLYEHQSKSNIVHSPCFIYF